MIIRQFHTDKFTITVETEPDHDFNFRHWDEELASRTRADLDAGRLELFGVKASVTYRGHEIATDYLGGCIYERSRDFMDHRGINQKSRKDGIKYGSYFSDMVRSVIAEARKHLAQCQRVHLRAA